MGIRQTQPMGLPPEAEAYLKKHAIVKDLCEHCGRDSGYERTEIGRLGMFEDLPLFAYRLNDGRVAREFSQATIWSSGPMIWLGLQVEDAEFPETYVWLDSEIKE